MRQAAQLSAVRLGASERGFTYACDALVEDPADTAGDAELWRLAEPHEAWPALAAALAYRIG